MIPYGKQTLDNDDINAINEFLHNSKFLTTGPYVDEFEKQFRLYTGSKYAVAVNSGTAALHVALSSIDLNKGDEVIVPAISFVATSNTVLYNEALPIFCDIDHRTMNIDPEKIENLITDKTKAIITVDMGGQPCEYDKILEICKKHQLYLIEDAAHSLGATYYINNNIHIVGDGHVADLVSFSFHPVKHITTCEGGMVCTNNELFYQKMLSFRNHGIDRTFKQRELDNSHIYHMTKLGFNYRIPDLLCTLGISQLKKLPLFLERRKAIAKYYDCFFSSLSKLVNPLTQLLGNDNSYHLYILKLRLDQLMVDRDTIFIDLKKNGIGVNVHYRPIYQHPYYQQIGYSNQKCEIAEDVYKQIITIPIFPTLDDSQLQYITSTIKSVLVKNWKKNINIVYLFNSVLEKKWIAELFQNHYSNNVLIFNINHVHNPDFELLYVNPIFVIDDLNNNSNNQYIQKYSKNNIKYQIIHLSDQKLDQPTRLLSKNECCNYIYCNYYLDEYESSMLFFQLGVKSSFWDNYNGFNPINISIGNRKYIWSFCHHCENETVNVYFKKILNITPNYWYKNDNSDSNCDLTISEYRDICLNSIFIPCLIDQINIDTSKLCEAIESGSIPIVLKYQQQFDFDQLFGPNPLIIVENWLDLDQLINQFLIDHDQLEKIRINIYNWYIKYKDSFKNQINDKLIKFIE